MAALLEMMLKEFRRLLARLAGQPGTHLQRRLRHVGGAGTGGGAAVLVSMDNAKVHRRLRLMKTRRDPPPILADMRKQIFPLLTAASMSSTDIRHGSSSAPQVCAWFHCFTERTVRRKRTFADACIELYYELCETPGCTIAEPELFHMHRYRLHWDQFIPLPPLSPDLHSPIEHMVGTIEGQDQGGT
jgi:hypothetical protein